MRQLQALATLSRRALSSSVQCRSATLKSPMGSGSIGMCPTQPGYQNVQKLQSQWGATEGGKMVWQKIGSDSPSYALAMLLTVSSLGMIGYIFYDLTFPKKK